MELPFSAIALVLFAANAAYEKAEQDGLERVSLDFAGLDEGGQVVDLWRFEFRNLHQLVDPATWSGIELLLILDGKEFNSVTVASWERRVVGAFSYEPRPGLYTAVLVATLEGNIHLGL